MKAKKGNEMLKLIKATVAIAAIAAIAACSEEMDSAGRYVAASEFTIDMRRDSTLQTQDVVSTNAGREYTELFNTLVHDWTPSASRAISFARDWRRPRRTSSRLSLRRCSWIHWRNSKVFRSKMDISWRA